MDRYQTGALAGGAAALIMPLGNIIYIGPPLYHIPAKVLCGNEHSIAWYVFGFLMHLAIGVGYGVVFAHIKPYKARYTWLRGLTFGLSTWFFEYVFCLMFDIQPVLSLTALQKLTLLAPHLLYGITLGYLLPWTAVLASSPEH